MKRTAVFAAIAAVTLVLTTTPPASAGGANLQVDPTSGEVGEVVDLTLDCGGEITGYDVYFVDSPETAYRLVLTATGISGSGPFEFGVAIPSVLDEGPDAPFDVTPGTYEFVAECSNQVQVGVEFTVTGDEPTTTTSSTTAPEETTTTAASAAAAVELEPTFTG